MTLLVIDSEFRIFSIFAKALHFPLFLKIYVSFAYFRCFSFLPTLNMNIIQCTNWTPLNQLNTDDRW